MNKLTVIIPCKNERLNIRPCIESAKQIADEVLVADSGSTDGTLDIAKELGCRVIEREYIHSGDFKNWAIPQATHDWVMIIDADERIPPDLAAEIKSVLASPNIQDGYWVFRRNYFMGHLIRHSGWGNDSVLRLFRRDLGRYVGDTDHAEVRVSTGKVGKLKSRLQHFTYWSYDQYFRKFERYTKWQAKVWYEQGRRPSVVKLLFTAPLRFLRGYVVQGGFLDGIPGFQVCMMHGFYSFMKQARLWEHHWAIRQPDPENEVNASRQPSTEPVSNSNSKQPSVRAA